MLLLARPLLARCSPVARSKAVLLPFLNETVENSELLDIWGIITA